MKQVWSNPGGGLMPGWAGSNQSKQVMWSETAAGAEKCWAEKLQLLECLLKADFICKPIPIDIHSFISSPASYPVIMGGLLVPLAHRAQSHRENVQCSQFFALYCSQEHWSFDWLPSFNIHPSSSSSGNYQDGNIQTSHTSKSHWGRCRDHVKGVYRKWVEKGFKTFHKRTNLNQSLYHWKVTYHLPLDRIKWLKKSN